MKKYNQHYVPCSILRNFANNDNVFCLIKAQNGNNKIIESNVKNLCTEKDFYCFSLDLEEENTSESFDYDKNVFDKIDSKMASITKKIVDAHSINILNNDEKKELAKYVVYQYIRSPAAKNVAVSLSTHERDARQIQGLSLLDQNWIQQVSDSIFKLKLRLLEPNKNIDFIISDSPVLWSPTGEVYFPISPKNCLCYQATDDVPLDSLCINELEFLASVKFNIAYNKSILNDIWDNTHKSHINNFVNTGTPSFWKCILKKKTPPSALINSKLKYTKDSKH